MIHAIVGPPINMYLIAIVVIEGLLIRAVSISWLAIDLSFKRDAHPTDASPARCVTTRDKGLLVHREIGLSYCIGGHFRIVGVELLR